MSNATYDGIFLAPESIVVFPGLATSALSGFMEAAGVKETDGGHPCDGLCDLQNPL